MKVKAIVFLTIIISTFAHAASPLPKCEAKDVGSLKPNYDDNSWYYQCTGVDKYESLPCYGGKWFSFAHQECVIKSEWLPPIIPTSPATVTTTPVTVPTNPTTKATVPTNPTTKATFPTNPTTKATVPTNPTTKATVPTNPTTITTIVTPNKIPDVEPPYKYTTLVPDHPTPPTRPPKEAPTPSPTAADTPEPTLPTAPPISLLGFIVFNK